MVMLSYTYRFALNFLFLGMAYVSLNYVERYQQRAIVGMVILAYVVMRGVSVLRTFYFFHQIEKLENETSSLRVLTKSPRSATEKEVAALRWQGEVKTYMELLFLSLVVALCLAKIFSD
jgi:hypothetical protein